MHIHMKVIPFSFHNDGERLIFIFWLLTRSYHQFKENVNTMRDKIMYAYYFCLLWEQFC